MSQGVVPDAEFEISIWTLEKHYGILMEDVTFPYIIFLVTKITEISGLE